MNITDKEKIIAARDAAVKGFLALEDTASTMTAACHALAMTLLAFPKQHRASALEMALRQVRECVETVTERR